MAGLDAVEKRKLSCVFRESKQEYVIFLTAI
jgi:hypothetical protein